MPTLLMLPPQTATTRAWAARLSAALPGLEIVVAEDPAQAAQVAPRAEAAFGTMPPALLRRSWASVRRLLRSCASAARRRAVIRSSM